ncbi:SCAN domain-containing protein 3-like [Oopsacas minuta]|uniref:SCAN domain-containing protein 3-like n=1 Tax=Oopsacas minuta TaxID=111878 RepID=A0AAV7KKM6_9METZ|nr:SCAN domain-containing protein 3-like [Oopsacas minuta]
MSPEVKDTKETLKRVKSLMLSEAEESVVSITDADAAHDSIVPLLISISILVINLLSLKKKFMAKRKRGQLDTYLTKRNRLYTDSQDISGFDEDELIDKSNKPGKRGCTKIRNYDISFIRFGFTSIFKDGLQKPQSLVCGEVLSNEALKPSKLSRHLQTKYKDLISKSVELFKRKRTELTGCQIQMYVSSHTNVSALRASYKVSLRIAKAKKTYIIGEQLLVGCIGDVCREMLGESAAKITARVPLSNNTVARRVIDLAWTWRNS